MALFHFESYILDINHWHIIKLPIHISEQLPSRGMVMAAGTLNGITVQMCLEPDGMGSHWFELIDDFAKTHHLATSDLVSVTCQPLNNWPEPDVPEDLSEALKTNGVEDQWQQITAKAHWAWIRWLRFTSNPETRQKRINTACSMLASGKKRPCCFDQSRCTITEVAKNGVLLL